MQPLWCWRCRTVVRMLDESEYAEVRRRYRAAFRSAAELRQFENPPGATTRERFQPVRAYHAQLTGMDCHENAIMHHRLSLYGPPCRHCQKPLRTPNAKLCGTCMAPVDTEV